MDMAVPHRKVVCLEEIDHVKYGMSPRFQIGLKIYWTIKGPLEMHWQREEFDLAIFEQVEWGG